ncbi:MAG: bifunctional oligoribonuclease/PAP phosphatase NrnA [Magnetococcales bacterium]|nr:bifunctional oligoribonuclease/PAP phosphatase NrnA [Magnetococcales bacterium]
MGKGSAVESEIKNEKTLELYNLLKDRDGERHAVIIQDFPDPDAISCAFAYRLISDQFGIETDLLYGGRISHQENIALIHLLDINIVRWQRDDIPKDRYQGSVFVDNQGTTSNLTDAVERAEVPITVMVDHHVDQERLVPQFKDLRTTGSCAAIFADYLASGILTLRPGRSEHRRLATALMHGILSDTGSMIHAQALDFNSAAYLQPFSDNDLLVEILHQQRSHRVMEVIRTALKDRMVRDGFCLAGVGFLRSEERDAIPQAADFLLTEENVHTVVVYGIVSHERRGESIQGSLRTIKHTLGPDSFLKETLGKAEDGHFYGGGKAMAGGFEIPLGFLSGEDDPELAKVKWEAFNAKIRRKFFTRINPRER